MAAGDPTAGLREAAARGCRRRRSWPVLPDRDGGSGDEPSGLAGGCLVQQANGQARVAGGVAFLGVGEDGGGFAVGAGGSGRARLHRQGGDDGGELGGRVAGEVDDGGEADGQGGAGVPLAWRPRPGQTR